MKAAMQAHVDQERHVMFQQSADEARHRLVEMVEQVSMTMSDRMDQVLFAMRRDYRAVLGGGETQGEILPKSQRLLRKQVMTTLDGVEQLFKKVLGQATDDDWNAEGGEKNLKEIGKDQDFDVDDALFQEFPTNEPANRQLKSEEGERKDVPMDDIPGSASRIEDNSMPNNQGLTKDEPQLPSDHFPASTEQENVKTESIFEHHEDAHVDQSTLGQSEPHEQGTASSDRDDFNSTGTREDDEEEAPPTEPEQDELMDSFESFPHSDYE